VQDTVLRTSALSLQIAAPGTQVNQSTGASNDGAGPNVGPEGSQNTVIGASGGQANLFGSIPGKSGIGIDVTVSLATRINSILRIVDQDSFGGLFTGDYWPAGIFGCRQTYTGAVQNYIPSVHLTGNLKISPGITSDGKLRIAKATISSPANDKARVALAACLMPYAPFTANQGATDALTTKIPTYLAGFGAFTPAPANPSGLVSDSDPSLPQDSSTQRPGGAPTAANCNDAPTDTVAKSTGGQAPVQVTSLTGPAGPSGYSTSSDGSKVSVAGDLTVNNVDVDVLIGDA
jgi:hypothetical protein